MRTEEDDDPIDEDWGDDEPSTDSCPYCKAEIFEDALQCPSCGMYLSSEDSPAPAKSTWFLVAAILALLGMALTTIYLC